MKTAFCFLLGAAAVLAAGATTSFANDRYADRPPVMVSPDLSAPWVLQLGHAPGIVRPSRQATTQQPLRRLFQAQPDRQRTAAVQQPAKRMVMRPQMNPLYLPQEVAYDGPQKPGTIVIDTHQNFLFLIEKNGKARRYGVGTGKPGFEWSGTHKITDKKVWPDWRPPAAMIAREAAKGRYLPTYLAGGIENPLGARALYLGTTEYRIHGTNQPWTIGGAVSSGCIRMRNEDVVDLYERVNVGTTVEVI
ncbi:MULTISPECIES: L,D-transpeptidase [unclassified Mesorhizobium]|uniref:L,D-transpeptidase n=1 Tax=unclassified Mesorhizobium TaxID=325217 RepID=UPI000F751373|nr:MULTISPECIES: L,D-transpeptidase [unclassified Mesorhizobium]AZO32058.1 L,D-transpeptidase [Mesorhizobium sp. M1B.F.Ca.ET.045.04.1.1]RWB18899.1 MAG: L,D-transpeptidase [Mesorhizobium sp.]